MNARPGGGVGCERAIVVAAGIVHIPEERFGIESLLGEPIAKREAVERDTPAAALGPPIGAYSQFHGHGKDAALAKIMDQVGKTAELRFVFGTQARLRLDALLPASIKKKVLLRGEAKMPFVPLAVFQDSQVGEKLADQGRLFTGNGNVVSGPRVCGDLILTPAGITSGL